jgi:hypothetical protein
MPMLPLHPPWATTSSRLRFSSVPSMWISIGPLARVASEQQPSGLPPWLNSISGMPCRQPALLAPC